MKKVELIAPAGDLEKLKIAFLYGADAVYASTPNFSMRTREIGFDYKSLSEGIKYAHNLGKRVYLTVNTFPHSSEIQELKSHIKKLIKIKPDAFIVADPGVINFIHSMTNIPIHLSTQANTTNYLSANFWKDQGITRIVLARELSFYDIKDIREKVKINLEAFVHGAMCMAYSGRCQISNYFANRDPNKGECVHACRFKYKMYGLEEEMREGEIFNIFEDDSGSYILNSKDLCMINHIPELISAGVSSFKIEGRLKSIYYVGIIVRAYRHAIDLYFDDMKKYEKKKREFIKEVEKTSSRLFTTGFYFDKPNSKTNNYKTSRAASEWGFVGIVKKYDEKEKMITIEVKNYLPKNSNIEIVTPNDIIKTKLTKIMYKRNEIDVAHSGYIIKFNFKKAVPPNSFVRAKVS